MSLRYTQAPYIGVRFVAILSLLTVGCIIVDRKQPGPVIPPPGHVHTHACGHYFRAGRWYHSHGHVHAHGCGHHLIAGNWTHVQAAQISASHIHSADCGHYFHRGQWFYVEGHTHTPTIPPTCGHEFEDGKWILR